MENKPPVKVLYVSHNASFQGSVMSLYTLIRGLDRERFTPIAAFAKHGPVVDRLRQEGVDAKVLARRGFLGAGLVREAFRLVKDEGVGIVHLNNAVPFCKYVALAARLAGLRVVWHVREPTQGKRVRRLEPWIRLLSTRIAVVNTEQESFFGPAGKVRKIYNGVDVSEFNPAVDGGPLRRRAGFGPDDFVFGIVGTIEPRKGTMLFLEAARMLVKDAPAARFLIVGSGLPEYEDEMRRFLEENPPLKQRTFLTGRITGVPEAMAALDVLVMPSAWEGFPRVVIEAMASARPVIASAVGEVPEIIQDGKTGAIVAPGDLGQLLKAMRMSMGSGACREVMGKAARERAVARFNLENHVRVVQDLYEETLRKRG